MTQKEIDDIQATLEAPGAGIPWYSKIFLKTIIKPFVAARTPLSETELLFVKSFEKIQKEIRGLSDDQLSKRTLVPRLQGLEDSSRFWSIKMTIEHIDIVSRALHRVIKDLSEEKPHQVIADTALVKPLGTTRIEEILQSHMNFAKNEFPKIKELVSSRDSKTTHLHPWFGAMTARQWFWLIAIHQNLHLNQIRAIKTELNKSKLNF